MLDATGTCQRCMKPIGDRHARWFANVLGVRVAKCQQCGPWTPGEVQQATRAMLLRQPVAPCNCRGAR